RGVVTEIADVELGRGDFDRLGLADGALFPLFLARRGCGAAGVLRPIRGGAGGSGAEKRNPLLPEWLLCGGGFGGAGVVVGRAGGAARSAAGAAARATGIVWSHRSSYRRFEVLQCPGSAREVHGSCMGAARTSEKVRGGQPLWEDFAGGCEVEPLSGASFRAA